VVHLLLTVMVDILLICGISGAHDVSNIATNLESLPKRLSFLLWFCDGVSKLCSVVWLDDG
jgi:hypothetical protein